jgi:hypothetical protein
MASTIEVARLRGYMGTLRKLKVLLDNQEVAALRPDETIRLQVEPGSHTIAVKMDWAKTPPLELECKERGTVRVEASPAPFLIAAAASFLWPSRAFRVQLA